MKIIKNSKDFFDQSLDEIKLLNHINASTHNVDNVNVLKLYDYFYYKEHLFIGTVINNPNPNPNPNIYL